MSHNTVLTWLDWGQNTTPVFLDTYRYFGPTCPPNCDVHSSGSWVSPYAPVIFKFSSPASFVAVRTSKGRRFYVRLASWFLQEWINDETKYENRHNRWNSFVLKNNYYFLNSEIQYSKIFLNQKFYNLMPCSDFYFISNNLSKY